MEKILLIYIIIEKQKLNGQKPSKGLNILISVGFMAVVVLLLGRQMMGFILGADINGKDIIGILSFTYGASNLIYSMTVDYKEGTSQAFGSATAEEIEKTGGKEKNSDLNIITMINYGENEKREIEIRDRKKLRQEKPGTLIKKEQEDQTIKEKAAEEIITAPSPQETPLNSLKEQSEIKFDFTFNDKSVPIEEDALTINKSETTGKEEDRHESVKTRFNNEKENDVKKFLADIL